MRLLSTLEDRLESVVTRLFFRKGRSRVHPVEIAQALVRAMERKQSFSVDKVYVPNVFRISLHPQDLESLAPIRKTVERDLIQYCGEVARKRGYDFAGPIRLLFAGDDERSIGTVKVDVSFLESPDNITERRTAVAHPTSDSKEANDIEQQTKQYPVQNRTEDQTFLAKALAPSHFVLRVVEGQDEGKAVVLSERHDITIGRSAHCDFVLSDAQVSKKHAKIWHSGARWRIRDLKSTNGTFRNGKPVQDELLDVGDELTLGMTTLRLVHEELP